VLRNGAGGAGRRKSSFVQRIPKIFSPMITTSGTPQSQRTMLFMRGLQWMSVLAH
jgi:hypothetical protein